MSGKKIHSTCKIYDSLLTLHNREKTGLALHTNERQDQRSPGGKNKLLPNALPPRRLLFSREVGNILFFLCVTCYTLLG